MNMFALKHIGIFNATSFTCFGLWETLLSRNFKNNSEALCLLLWEYYLFRQLQLLYGINRHKLSLKSLVLSVWNTFLTLPFKYCLLHYAHLKNPCCIFSLHVYLMFNSTPPHYHTPHLPHYTSALLPAPHHLCQQRASSSIQVLTNTLSFS